MAPEIFHQVVEQSVVYHQPSNERERLKALQALLSCPTASIATVDKPKDIQTVQQTLPIPIDRNVYHCGYHAESSFGAASYLIRRPEGNILVDSPRFAAPLIKNLEKMGGVRYLYLTHRDDVADHQKFRDHFGCDRILHQNDIDLGTKGVEIQLKGIDPIAIADDLLIIPVPGHTKGHTVLLYEQKYLFSGDHLAWSEENNRLIAFKNACWYSWKDLVLSMGMLAEYPFEWVLPGHGRRYHADLESMARAMQECLDSLH
jgi:glyoxylase-like metal-dependent hydrolase (beta-lactamase superfamily II)